MFRLRSSSAGRRPARILVIAALCAPVRVCAQTPPPVPAVDVPANLRPDKNPFVGRSSSDPFGPCGDARVPVRIIGRVPRAVMPGETGYADFVPHAAAVASGTAGLPSMMAELQTDPAKYLADVRKLQASAAASMPADPQAIQKRLTAQTKAMMSASGALVRTALDKNGVFHCNGLATGWYDVTIGVQRPEAATGKQRARGNETVASQTFKARVFVPKPTGGHIAVVSPVDYSRVVDIDPNRAR